MNWVLVSNIPRKSRVGIVSIIHFLKEELVSLKIPKLLVVHAHQVFSSIMAGSNKDEFPFKADITVENTNNSSWLQCEVIQFLHHIDCYYIYCLKICYQWTALHIAVREGGEHTVKCIVGDEADVNIKGSEGVSICDLVYLLKVDYNVVQLIWVCQWV